ncbi:MAG: MFS transporter [Desulfobacterales bacterium]|nr:MFS transporter [Desulfobacterales bacterium]
MNGSRPTSAHGKLTPLLVVRIFLPFALGYFLSYLYRTVNAVIAPNLAADIGVDPSGLGLLTAAYFIAFASSQLPLGILLDRYGPRRIEATLLLFAAAGAYIFSRSDSLAGLAVGRALIGFGVSACLMAAFKAFVMWFPAPQLPLINGIQMTSGGLGALSATAPVESLLGIMDWRAVFLVLALATLAVALVVFFVVPDKTEDQPPDSPRNQLIGIGEVFSSPVFWRIAPWATLSQAAYLAIQGLWSGPWLRDVAGFDRRETAGMLLLVAAAMTAGYLLLGILANRLSRAGWKPLSVAVLGMLIFMLVQTLIVCGWVPDVRLVWMLFGFFGTSGILCYADLSQRFPARLAGRVNTGLNLLVFVVAFAAQWGIGAVIDLWPSTADGYAIPGYQAGFGVMLGLQAVALAWFLLAGRRQGRVRPVESNPTGPNGSRI